MTIVAMISANAAAIAQSTPAKPSNGQKMQQRAEADVPHCTRKLGTISIVYGGGRNPNEFPFLANVTEAERWAIVCENRPVLMNWIVCSSKNPVP
eukprot:gene24559-30409_t